MTSQKPAGRALRVYGLLLASLALAAARASANVVDLTFEGLGNDESIDTYYDGGFGGNGSGPGPNYGITFTSDSLALIAGNAPGGGGNFDGALAPSPDTIAFFLTGAGDTMDVAAGFTTGFSFFYDNPYYTGSVTVWSGLDGTGTQLLSLTLNPVAENPNATYGSYNAWAEMGGAFSGTAESVIFGGVANQIGFDNITLGSSVAVGRAPDSGGFSLVLEAAAAMIAAGFLFRPQARQVV
ncbi:MAG TPA: hypothetical protein VGL42_12515 [Opitutaceae bacterium]|jgi:hypothetical protein